MAGLPSLSLSLLAEFLASRNLMFYFSVATLVLGITGAIYLLVEWLYHRRERKFALFWAVGLFLLYWFQVPAILFNANQSFTLTDFNTFFSFAFPTAFIGSLFIYAGILSVARSTSPKRNTIFVLWAAVATVLFIFYFANRNTITSYAPAFIFILGFFMPIHILSLVELRRWYKNPDWPKTKICYFGLAILIVSFLLRLFQNFFALDKLLQLSPEFWFLVVANSSALFVIQALGTLLLLVGFFFVHQSCCMIANGKHKKQ